MGVLQNTIEESAERIRAMEEAVAHVEGMLNEVRQQHRQIVNWAEVYDAASLEERRVIAAYLVKAVTVSRGYDIQLEFNISEAQYLNGLEMG